MGKWTEDNMKKVLIWNFHISELLQVVIWLGIFIWTQPKDNISSEILRSFQKNCFSCKHLLHMSAPHNVPS